VAIATLAALRAAMEAPHERVLEYKTVAASAGQVLVSTWITAPLGASAPTTAEAPTRASTGAIGQRNGGADALRLVRLLVHPQGGAGLQCASFLVDRLSHQGGLSGIVTTEQTANLPTAALTRYTTGEDVFAAVEIHSTIGTTATTATLNYTNQAGTAGRTSPPFVIGGAGFRENNRFIRVPLQQGDTGVRSVQGITLAASTGTAGAFGIVLYKQLLSIPSLLSDYQLDFNPLLGLGGMFPEIVDDACLHFLVRTTSASPGPFQAELSFAED
jgi:hypothetical protein